MNTKQQAIADIRSLAVRLRGVLALADELERVGSIEQAASESQGRYDEAVRIEKEVLANVEKAERQAGSILAAAGVERDRIVAEARTQIEEAQEQTASEARSLIAKANESADVAYARRDHANEEAAQVEEMVKTTREELATVEAKLAEAREALEALRSKVG